MKGWRPPAGAAAAPPFTRRHRCLSPAAGHIPLRLAVVAALQPDASAREIGRLAVWSVTTAKPGNGVELLRDGRDDTYWQSDGAQPHLVNVQFQKKVGCSLLAKCLEHGGCAWRQSGGAQPYLATVQLQKAVGTLCSQFCYPTSR